MTRAIDRKIIKWFEDKRIELSVRWRVYISSWEKYILKNKIFIEIGFIAANTIVFIVMILTIAAMISIVSKCNCV